jgi:hypothetical protein
MPKYYFQKLKAFDVELMQEARISTQKRVYGARGFLVLQNTNET